MENLKTFLRLGMTCIAFVSIVLFSGCVKKMKTSTYEDYTNNASISLSYPEDSKCVYSTDEKDICTSTEEAVLTSDNYKIAWDIVSSSYDGDFEKVKDKAFAKDEGKEVEYNSIRGVSYYYSPYVRYNVCLPINDKCYIEFHIYSTNESHDRKHVDEVFNSEEVQNILKTVSVKKFIN